MGVTVDFKEADQVLLGVWRKEHMYRAW